MLVGTFSGFGRSRRTATKARRTSLLTSCVGFLILPNSPCSKVQIHSSFIFTSLIVLGWQCLLLLLLLLLLASIAVPVQRELRELPVRQTRERTLLLETNYRSHSQKDSLLRGESFTIYHHPSQKQHYEYC